MIIDHGSALPGPQQRYAVNYGFFASQHNFSYALAQENPYFTRLSLLQIPERIEP